MPMLKRMILETTVIDGVGFTRECLVNAAASINGDKALRLGLEHDEHYVPIGKIRAAEIIDLEEETVLAAIDDDTHIATTTIHEPTGNRMVEITFPNDERPFVLHVRETSKATLNITADRVNFDSQENFDAFLNAVNEEVDAATTTSMVRRSLTPEPVIQFIVSNPELSAFLTWWFFRGEKFVRYTIDETARKTADAISDKVSEQLKKWLGVYNRHRSIDEREVTSHIIINTEPQIHLLTRGEKAELNTEIGIESLCRQMELYQDLLETADSVTFARTAKDKEWKFLYMTTKSGNVITTEDCYEATKKKREDISRTFGVCLCLVHKTSREERHYETTAVITPPDEHGSSEIKINSVPKDFEEWEITNISLLMDDKTE